MDVRKHRGTHTLMDVARPVSSFLHRSIFYNARYRPIVNYPIKMLLISPPSILRLRRRLIFTSANSAQFRKNTATRDECSGRGRWEGRRGEGGGTIVARYGANFALRLSRFARQRFSTAGEGLQPRFRFAFLTRLPSGTFAAYRQVQI